MDQGDGLKSFPVCNGCSYLGKRQQKQYDIYYMLPFCKYYQLHFSSVRQINHNETKCIHYDEGNL